MDVAENDAVAAPAAERGRRRSRDAMDHEGKVLGLKVEAADREDAVIKQELDIEHAQLQWDSTVEPNPILKHEEEFQIKTEEEVDGVMVKQELDIGPSLLTPQTASCPLSLPAQVKPSPCLSSSAMCGASPALIYRAPQTDVVNDCCEEDSAVCFNADFVLDTKRDELYQKELRERPCDMFKSKDMSVGMQEKSQCRHHVRAPTECDFRTGPSKATAGPNAGEEHNICDNWQNNKMSKSTLIYEICSSSGEKRYRCEYCEYRASKLNNLKRHMCTHTGEKPYKCEQCDYSASQLGHIKSHMHTHTGVKPYKCKQCVYSASQLGHLKTHMLIHMIEKPYKCEQCEYSASKLDNLKVHIRIHTGEKPYKCIHCEYSASQIGQLKSHIRTHTGEKPYKCEECDYSASKQGNLKRHKRIHIARKR